MKNSKNSFGIVLIILGMVFAINICSKSKKKQHKKSTEPNVSELSEWRDLKRKEIKIVASSDAEPDLTRNFYFIFDGSGSMLEKTGRDCGGDQRFRNKLEGAQWAVRNFLKEVPETINIGLYVFDRNGRREVLPLGKSNKDEFLEKIDEVVAGGGTPLSEAIQWGTDQLIERYKTQLGYGEYRLVVITDGIAKRIYTAAKYAASYNIPLYSIGLCIGEEHPLRKYSVSYRAADNFDELTRGLAETLSELPNFNPDEFRPDEPESEEKQP